MRAGAFQFDVRRGEVEANLARVEDGLVRAKEAGVDLLVLPEMWPTSFDDPDRDEPDGEPSLLDRSDAAVERVLRLSGELGVAVCGSAWGHDGGGGPPFNRLHLFADGRWLLAYDKVHLFSPTAEGEGFAAGTSPPRTVELAAPERVRISGAVCYDLRFAPLLERPWLERAELLLVPAQWPEPRGGHLVALALGRAVEHQAFVVVANRTGVDRIGRRRLELSFPGGSLVAAPDGRLLASGTAEEGLVVADLDLGALRDLRKRVPVRRDRRSGLYEAWRAGGPTA